jgi:phosphoribosylamine---glycine ligase
MNVLLLGSGAREHALAWKMAQSPQLKKLFAMPGNSGIAAFATCVPGDAANAAQVLECAQANEIHFVVVGPEGPLVNGVVDALTKAGILAFGPTKGAAAIEGSKAFAKEVMAAAEIPTAHWEVFEDREKAAARAKQWGSVVVKADGLAAGKGVMVCDTGEAAAAACLSLGKTQAGQKLMLEERLSGPEISIMALCDGTRFALLPTSQDHKRLLDGDAGPNTGGMGAFAPSPLLREAKLKSLAEEIFPKMLFEMAARGAPFRGALYCGLMLTKEGPKVLEFNARLGDPETQVLMLQLDEDVLPWLVACALGQLPRRALKQKPTVSLGVVLAAQGYPENSRAGDVITGLPAVAALGDVHVFQGGTAMADGQLQTSGGRVLTVCASGVDLATARQKVYAAVKLVDFSGMQWRQDIGLRDL